MSNQSHKRPRTMKGIALLECSLLLILLGGMVAIFMAIVPSDSKTSKSGDAEISKTTSSIATEMKETRRGRSLEKLGPTEYQIQLLKQANEEYTRKTGFHAPQVMETKTELVKELEAQITTQSKPVLNKVTKALPVNHVEAKAPLEPPMKDAAHVNAMWTATATGRTVELSIKTGRSYAVINWGDGGRDNVYANGSFSGNHTYSTDGPYTLTVEGKEFTIIEHSENLRPQ